jgi:cyclopropane fatty-acyl-phospholipid synthase-like methyltransferase
MKIKETLQNNLGYTGHEFDGTNNPECPGYGRGDGTRTIGESEHASYRALAESIANKFPDVKSILELGCGAGNLSAHYRSLRPEVLYVTVDINAESPTLGLINPDTHAIAFTDRPFNIVDEETGELLKFDLILSFEHFEHIPEERIENLFQNILKHSKTGTIGLATAAAFHSIIHPTIWERETWYEVFKTYGLEPLNDGVLGPHNKPYNFELSNTHELMFIRK